jgi:hypothetical protein
MNSFIFKTCLYAFEQSFKCTFWGACLCQKNANAFVSLALHPPVEEFLPIQILGTSEVSLTSRSI